MNKNSKIYKTVSALRFRELNMALSEFDFPYAIVKGEALSVFAYGKLGERVSRDIDLLIERKNVGRASAILKKKGFEQNVYDREGQIMMMNFSHQTLPFRKRICAINIEVDLNYSVFWGEYKSDSNLTTLFLSNVIPVQIYNFQIYTLSPMKALAHLILHQYKDMNSIYLLATRKQYSKAAFEDIYNLLKANIKEIPMLEFYDFCEEIKICPYVYYVLYHTNFLFEDSILQDFVEVFKSQQGMKLLDYYGLTNSERKMWKYDIETRMNSIDLFQLMEQDLTKNDLKKIEYNLTKM